MIAHARMRNARGLRAACAFALAAALAPAPAAAQGNDGRVSLSTGIDFSNAYFFRGILQRREGLIIQPYADITFDVWSDADGQGLTGVSYTLGQWNSLHTTTHQHHHVPHWYESDFYTGMSFALDNWETGVTYTLYGSPSHAFASVHELAFNVGLDDSELSAFPLNPSALLAVELQGGADGGAARGIYLELGIEPSFGIGGDAAISTPVTVGLSPRDYYENGPSGMPGPLANGFGFFSVGAVLSVPLPVPESLGAWEISAGVHLLSLGEFLETVNRGDQLQAIAAFGFGISY